MTRARLAARLAALALALFAAPAARAASPEPAPAPQSRAYGALDLLRTQRLAIAALQDLGFALESADAESGAITASRLDAHALRLSVSLRTEDASTVLVSVATDYVGTPVHDPRAAEAFFEALARQLAPPPALD